MPFFIVLMIVGILAVATGYIVSRSVHRRTQLRSVLTPGTLVVLALWLAVPADAVAWRQALLALVVALAGVNIVSNRHVISWRRPEQVLLLAAAVALAASYFLTGVSSEIRLALAYSFAVLALLAIVFTIVNIYRAVRSRRDSA